MFKELTIWERRESEPVTAMLFKCPKKGTRCYGRTPCPTTPTTKKKEKKKRISKSDRGDRKSFSEKIMPQ